MSRRLEYKPALDGLRATAALMVLFAHYFVELSGPDFRYGGNGVQIFFVISGYLITYILLSQKNEGHGTKVRMIGSFIIKRALRLFPVYYLFLTVLVVISSLTGLWLTKEGTLWHYFTYTQNYLFLKEGFQSTLLNHTWSLAVEEQFYLFWPFLLFLIPKRTELWVLIVVFAFGVLSKIYFINFYQTSGTVKGVTFIHFDTLGAGALMAYFIYYGWSRVIAFLNNYCLHLFLFGFIASGTLTFLGREDAFFLPLSLIIMSVGLVHLCTNSPKTFVSALLSFPVLARLGKISYGIYLFHKPVPFFVNQVLASVGLKGALSPFLLFAIYTSIAIGIAGLSWRWFERYFLKQKEKFDL